MGPFSTFVPAVRRHAGTVVTLAGLLATWELGVRLAGVPRWLLPSPLAIAAAAWETRDRMVHHTIVTLVETLAGFTAALVFGLLLATALVASPFLRRVLDPILAGIQAVPKNALAPIFVLWFGGGELSKIAITFLISFFPIVINTVSGMTLVDRDMIYLTRTLRASPLQTFLHVRIPNAVPALFAACKIAITLAVVGAVIGEFVGSDEGLGYLIMVESSQLRTDVAFVAIVLLGLCGVLLFAAVSAIESMVVPWMTAPSAEEAHEHAT